MNLEEKRKLFLKHLILVQLTMESADDCVNNKVIVQREKQESKRYCDILTKRYNQNFSTMYQTDDKTFISITDFIDTIVSELSELDLNELLTFNNKINEFISAVKENTPKPEQSGVDDVHRNNNEEIRETVLG
jgi:hypothetical protein